MLTEKDKKEIEAVCRNGNAVANNLASQSDLIAAGVIHSLIQTVMWFSRHHTALEKDLDTAVNQLADINKAYGELEQDMKDK